VIASGVGFDHRFILEHVITLEVVSQAGHEDLRKVLGRGIGYGECCGVQSAGECQLA